MTRRARLFLVAILSISCGALVLALQTSEADALRATDAPANAVFVDTLDMTPIANITPPILRRPGRGGTGGRGATPSPTPPSYMVIPIGGVTYPHALPMMPDRDLSVDLKGSAVRFAAMVGIDSGLAAGRGSVIFGVWVDGRKAADSGVVRGGDAPKLLTADLKGAKK